MACAARSSSPRPRAPIRRALPRRRARRSPRRCSCRRACTCATAGRPRRRPPPATRTAAAFRGGVRAHRAVAGAGVRVTRGTCCWCCSSLPSTLIGGVAAVALTGGTLTLGAMVGFVALFGMAARNTILLVSHYDHSGGTRRRSLGASRPLCAAPRSGLTPVLLTALLTGAGAAAGRAAAASARTRNRRPDGGGYSGRLVSSTLVSLLLIPPLAARWLRPSG